VGLAWRARNSTGDASQKVQCSSCHLRAGCLPAGLSPEELEQVDGRLVSWRRKVARGEALFRAGDRFDTMFAVWFGFFKTVISSTQGCEQVTGFRMAGEVIGLDGIETARHRVDAVALENSQVCVVPFSELEALEREVPSLQRQFHRIMSQRIACGYDVMFLLGSMYAEERVAAFLLELTHRLQTRGFSASRVVLRMSRVELGSFLGLTVETVSRTLTKFQTNGLLVVQQKQIQIADPAGLQQLIDRVQLPGSRQELHKAHARTGSIAASSG
jgi:CRP/FNR family transcriptional regulator